MVLYYFCLNFTPYWRYLTRIIHDDVCMSALTFLHYLSYNSNLGADFLRRNFHVYRVCSGYAYGARANGLLRYTSTLPLPFPLRLVHITPNVFGAWCIIRVKGKF